MTIVEHEPRRAAVDQLEELWNAPAVEPPAPPARRARSLGLGRTLALSWAVFLTVALVAMPAGDPNAVIPAWAWASMALYWIGLFAAAGFAAAARPFDAYLGSAVAGVAGVALGVGCLTSGHHVSGWAVFELVGVLPLLALSVLGLRRAT